MIEKEIAVYLLAYNLVRWTMAAAATLADVLPRTLSFTGTNRLLAAFADQLRHAPGKRMTLMAGIVLSSIAMLKLPNRPDRIEPRAKKTTTKTAAIVDRAARCCARRNSEKTGVRRGLNLWHEALTPMVPVGTGIRPCRLLSSVACPPPCS